MSRPQVMVDWDSHWHVIAVHLLELGSVCPMELDEIPEFDGESVVEVALGVVRPDAFLDIGETILRFNVDVRPINSLFVLIEEDLDEINVVVLLYGRARMSTVDLQHADQLASLLQTLR